MAADVINSIPNHLLPAITTGLFALIAAMLTFLFSLYSARRQRIFNTKFELYSEFVSLSARAVNPKEADQVQYDYLKIKQQILLLGDREMINEMKKLNPFDLSQDDQYKAFSNILKKMRKDLKINFNNELPQEDIDILLNKN